MQPGPTYATAHIAEAESDFKIDRDQFTALTGNLPLACLNSSPPRSSGGLTCLPHRVACTTMADTLPTFPTPSLEVNVTACRNSSGQPLERHNIPVQSVSCVEEATQLLNGSRHSNQSARPHDTSHDTVTSAARKHKDSLDNDVDQKKIDEIDIKVAVFSEEMKNLDGKDYVECGGMLQDLWSRCLEHVQAIKRCGGT
jgi:hypothetical protein